MAKMIRKQTLFDPKEWERISKAARREFPRITDCALIRTLSLKNAQDRGWLPKPKD